MVSNVNEDAFAHIKTMAESLPDNERTRKILAKREEERREKEEKDAEERRRMEIESKELKKKADKAKADKERQQQKQEEELRQRAAQEEAATQINGKLKAMLVCLRANETPREYSLAGIHLGGARTTILARHVAYNETLTTLHLVRRGI